MAQSLPARCRFRRVRRPTSNIDRIGRERSPRHRDPEIHKASAAGADQVELVDDERAASMAMVPWTDAGAGSPPRVESIRGDSPPSGHRRGGRKVV